MFCTAILAITALAGHAAVPASCGAGIAGFDNGDFPRAQTLLWDCVQSGAPDRGAGYDLASTYRELKNYTEGLARAEAVLKSSPDNVDALYVAAFLQFRQGDSTRSLRLLSRADRLDRNDWRVHQLFALNYAVFNMSNSALSEFRRAIGLNPSDAELYYQLARYDFVLGIYPDSIEASERALAIYPDYAQVYDNLGLTYLGSGDTEQAAASFQKAISLNEKHGRRDEWPLIDYADFLLRQGSASPSVPLLEQALRYNPASSKANYHMGRAMRALDKDETAEIYFEKALELDPSDASACFALSSLIKKRGDSEKASQLLARYKTLRAKSDGPGPRAESGGAR